MKKEASSFMDALKKEIRDSIYHEFDFYINQTILKIIEEKVEKIVQEQIKIEMVQKDMMKMFVGYQEIVQENKKYNQLQIKQIEEVKQLLKKIDNK